MSASLVVDVVAVVAAVLLVALVVQYRRRWAGRPWTSYDARPAWIRAGIYFSVCWLLSWASGGMELIATSPVVTAEQLGDFRWWAWTALAFGFILIAYGIVWVRYTVRFDRPRNDLAAGVFGFLWGSSSGQLFLAVWLFANDTGLPEWGAWLATWLVLGAWQPNFHNIYWDHWIAPEHDTRMTQKIKALGCHIPNLAITLTYLALFDNYLLFVSLQVIACMSASLGMRFPAPSTPSGPHDLAHRSDTRPPRCGGYQPVDRLTDPYTPFYRGWRGPDGTGDGRLGEHSGATL
jgi:hypothetical protein